MSKILIEGRRLRLRRAEISDVDYIIELQHKPENIKFIVPFEEKFQIDAANSDGSEKMNIIVEEIATGDSVGYFLVQGLDTHKIEWTHVVIDKKGIGYGREALQLLMQWSFEIKKFHRGWLDCKTYNEVALHLYESLGLVREGILRDTIFVNGVYENLIVLGILDSEYFARKKA